MTVNASNVKMKMAVGATVLVQATGGNINLLLSDAGVVADVSLTSLSIPSIANVSLTAGRVRVLNKSAPPAVTQVGTLTENPAIPANYLSVSVDNTDLTVLTSSIHEIGRASCRERV